MAIDNPNDSLKAELAAKTATPASAETTSAVSATGIQTNPMSSPVAASSASASLANANPSSPYDYQGRVDTINKMYDSAINQTRSNLDSTYEQNRSDLEANREQLARTYQNQRNANAADYERARRNFNQQALANGLNTGAGSQAALAQNAVYNKNQGALGASEAAANTELDRSLANLKIQYQNSINSAIAENDYNRAATLLDEYNNQYSMAMNNAQLLSQYGDFSGYASLFGQDTADQMRQMWMYQNPGIAYSMGELSADDYYKLTGSYPPGYSSGGGGGGYYYYPSDDSESASDAAADIPLPGDSGTTKDAKKAAAAAEGKVTASGGKKASGGTKSRGIDTSLYVSGTNNLSSAQPGAAPVLTSNGVTRVNVGPAAKAAKTSSDNVTSKINPTVGEIAQNHGIDLSQFSKELSNASNATGIDWNPNVRLISELPSGSPAQLQALKTLYPDANDTLLGNYALSYPQLRDDLDTALAANEARQARQALIKKYGQSLSTTGTADTGGFGFEPISDFDPNINRGGTGGIVNGAPVLQSNGSLTRVDPSGLSNNGADYSANYQSMQQGYIDSLNAQEQAKADQYPSSSLYYYVPAQYQLVNGQIVRTGGKLLVKGSNPSQDYNPVQSASSLFPGYARQDSNNWIMGPNFRIPMTTNVSR